METFAALAFAVHAICVPAAYTAGRPQELAVDFTKFSTWSTGVVATGEPIVTDRDYRFTSIPKGMTGATYILRPCGKPGEKGSPETAAWGWALRRGNVEVSRPCTCYLAVLSTSRDRVLVKDSKFETLRKDRWELVEGQFTTTTPRNTSWTWHVFKCEVKMRGDVHFRDTAKLDGVALLIFAFK